MSPPRATAALASIALSRTTAEKPDGTDNVISLELEFQRGRGAKYELVSQPPESYSPKLQLPQRCSITYSVRGLQLPDFLIGVANYAPSKEEIAAAQKAAHEREVKAHNDAIIYKMDTFRNHIEYSLKVGNLDSIADFLDSSFAEELKTEFLIVEGKPKKTSAFIDILNSEIKIYQPSTTLTPNNISGEYDVIGNSRLFNYLCSQLNGSRCANFAKSRLDQDQVLHLIYELLQIDGIDIDAHNDALKIKRPLHHAICSGSIPLITRLCADQRVRVEGYDFGKDSSLMRELRQTQTPATITKIQQIVGDAINARAIAQGYLARLSPEAMTELLRNDAKMRRAPCP